MHETSGTTTAGIAALKGKAVTSGAPQAWYVMLQDEASAGKVIVPLKPFLRFSRRMAKAISSWERSYLKAHPELKRRKAFGRG